MAKIIRLAYLPYTDLLSIVLRHGHTDEQGIHKSGENKSVHFEVH